MTKPTTYKLGLRPTYTATPYHEGVEEYNPQTRRDVQRILAASLAGLAPQVRESDEVLNDQSSKPRVMEALDW